MEKLNEFDQLALDIIKRIDGMKADDVVGTLEVVAKHVREASLLNPVNAEAVIDQNNHLRWISGRQAPSPNLPRQNDPGAESSSGSRAMRQPGEAPSSFPPKDHPFRGYIDQSESPKSAPAYCGMTATKVNPDKGVTSLTIVTPSGKTYRISSNLVVIDDCHEGMCIADNLQADGVPFYRTMMMAHHLVKDAKSSSTV